MRSLHVVVLIAGLALAPRTAAAQQSAEQPDRQSARQGSGSATASTSTATVTTADGRTYDAVIQKPKAEQPEVPVGRWVRALTNVQVELTITDQTGAAGAAEKKTVSMVVSSGSWGKIRSVQYVREAGRDQAIDLNVDARPMVSVDGPIQLELTIVYSPPGTQTGEVVRLRPTGVNQSLTVVLQSGKPLVISQAADPVGDRKIIVEAKATVLK